MKFHLTSIVTNVVLIFGIMNLYYFIRISIEDMYFFKAGGSFEICFLYLILVFSWSSTFIIYRVKNKAIHFYYFLCSNIFGLIIFSIFDYISSININSIPFELSGLYISLESAILETIIPVFIISKCINVSQNVIGKKLLPTMYLCILYFISS
jgi:hypothetical protein